MGPEGDRAISDLDLPGIEPVEFTPDPKLPGLPRYPLVSNRKGLGFDMNEPGPDLNPQGFTPSAHLPNRNPPRFCLKHFFPNLNGFRFALNTFIPVLKVFIFDLSKFVSNLNSLRFKLNSPTPDPNFFRVGTNFLRWGLAHPPNLG